MTAPHKVWRLEIPDFEWLDRLNTTALIVLIYLGLLCLTGLVWSVCMLAGLDMNAGAFATWAGMIAVVGGIVAYIQQNYRKTDYGYQERQAAIEQAKASATQPTNVTVQSQQAQVNATPEGAK